MKKVITFLAALAAVTASLGGGAGAAQQPSGEPITFGYIDAFTGAASSPGIVLALQAYIDDWNDRGGYKGRPVQVKIDDVGFDPGKSQAAAREFGGDPNVIGLLSMGVCQFTKPLLASYQIPTLGAADPACPQDPTFMATNASQAPTVPMYKFAVDEGAPHFGMILPPITGFKEGWADPIQRYIDHHPKIGGEITSVEAPLIATGADYDGAIVKLKSAGATAVYAGVQANSMGLLLQSAIRNGFGPADGITWLSGPNTYDPALLASIPELEGTYFLSLATPWEETSDPQVKKMDKTIGDRVETKDGWNETGYQLGVLAEQSLKKLKGDVTRESLSQLWQSKPFTKYQPALVPFNVDFTDGSKNPAAGQILVAKNGKFEPASKFLVIPAKEFA